MLFLGELGTEEALDAPRRVPEVPLGWPLSADVGHIYAAGGAGSVPSAEQVAERGGEPGPGAGLFPSLGSGALAVWLVPQRFRDGGHHGPGPGQSVCSGWGGCSCAGAGWEAAMAAGSILLILSVAQSPAESSW